MRFFEATGKSLKVASVWRFRKSRLFFSVQVYSVYTLVSSTISRVNCIRETTNVREKNISIWTKTEGKHFNDLAFERRQFNPLCARGIEEKIRHSRYFPIVLPRIVSRAAEGMRRENSFFRPAYNSRRCSTQLLLQTVVLPEAFYIRLHRPRGLATRLSVNTQRANASWFSYSILPRLLYTYTLFRLSFSKLYTINYTILLLIYTP